MVICFPGVYIKLYIICTVQMVICQAHMRFLKGGRPNACKLDKWGGRGWYVWKKVGDREKCFLKLRGGGHQRPANWISGGGRGSQWYILKKKFGSGQSDF